MIIFTEIQNHLFNHSYFAAYIIANIKNEKKTDGRLRAFMFVERQHLNILWSYKAIKEEIKILHERLERINNTIKGNKLSKHLFLDDENENEKFDKSAHFIKDSELSSLLD